MREEYNSVSDEYIQEVLEDILKNHQLLKVIKNRKNEQITNKKKNEMCQGKRDKVDVTRENIDK